MVSTTGSRPTYYDALGLSPSASQEEIIKAFGKAMSLFGAHSVGSAAQLSLAFETLRNPLKRRAYDDSLGLAPKPEPAQPAEVSFRISARVVGTEPHVEQHLSAPPASVAAEPVAQAAREPKVASFIASSLRDIARPLALDTSGKVPRDPAPVREPAAAALEPELLAPTAVGEADDRGIDWKRPLIAVGGVLIAAGVVGALAGVSVRGDEQGGQEIGEVTAPLPPAKPQVEAAAPGAAKTPTRLATSTPPATATKVARAEPKPTPTASWAAVQPADAAAAATTASEEATTDPLAPKPAAADEVAADMPLANSVIARTIQRIGYRCGEVASTDAIDGAAGVYKVTCASGDTYRAAPVHGRYHFKRLSGD